MELDNRRKRLLWRASHRGTREMDLVIGGYARAHIGEMNERELAEFEVIVEIPDQDLMTWIIGEADIPARHRSATLARLLAYRP